MNNYEEIVGIKTRFENSTETELYGYLYSFQNKWVLTDNKNLNLFDNTVFKLNECYEKLITSIVSIDFVSSVFSGCCKN